MRRHLCLLGLLQLAACGEGLASEQRDDTPLSVGSSRELELTAVRFDVTNFEKRLTRDDLLRLPRDVRERAWLLDLDLSNGPNSPRLLDNALSYSPDGSVVLVLAEESSDKVRIRVENDGVAPEAAQADENRRYRSAKQDLFCDSR